MNALLRMACCLDDSSDDAGAATALPENDDAGAAARPAPAPHAPRIMETELRARDDGTRTYRLERRAVAWACEDVARRCANDAVDVACDDHLRDALNARLGLRDEMAACGLAEGELPLAFGSSRRERRTPKKKKRKKAAGPSRHEDAPNPQRDVDDKYWAQRFHYFSLYDCGIRLDAESWYSVTPENIALAIASRCSRDDVVVDAFCGCGGNAIALARRCKHVIAIDVDPRKIAHARHNARIYGVTIDFIVGDALTLLKTLKADVCFLSPPWGGPAYSARAFELASIDISGVDGFGLLALATKCAPRVAYYLPRTLAVDEALKLAPGRAVEVESQYLNDKLKAKTVYLGFGETVPCLSAIDGAALSEALERVGCVQLLVGDDLREKNEAVAQLCRAFFAMSEAHRQQFALADGADSGGYHGAGALGRYNAHRSGVIYETGHAVPALVAGGDFVDRVEAWRTATTLLARSVLQAVAAHRGAPAEAFAQGGAFDACAAGRFHVKRTHAGAARVLLPPHRDPSTLSIVTHFSAPPTGLEVRTRQGWARCSRAGSGVVTILAGSVLASVLPGIQAPTHRVVSDFDDDDRAPRVAATFFCEPRPDARMADVSSADTSGAPTYQSWRGESYKKYLKKKPPQT